MVVATKEKNINRKPSPDTGKVSTTRLTEGGKYEQTRKNRNISMRKPIKTIFTCVRKHAPIASQARHFPPSSGEADAKEERNYIFYIGKTKNKEMTHAGKLSPLVGESVNRQVDERGKCAYTGKNI